MILRKILALAILVAAIFTAAAPLRASTDAELIPSVGANAICPGTADLQEYSDYKGRGKPQYTFVVAAAPTLYQTAVRSAAKTSVAPDVFERIAIVTQYDTTRRMFVEWGASGALKCAWIGYDDVLYRPYANPKGFRNGPQPLQLSELPGAKGTGSNLWLRAVSANLNTPGDVVETYTDTTGKKVFRKYRVFEMFTVLQTVRAPPTGPDTSRPWPDNAEAYYLLGEMNDLGEVSSVVGWVRELEVYKWSTRAAAYWAGPNLGPAWFKRDDVNSDTVAPFVPAPKQLPEFEDHTEERFPIIDQTPDAESVNASGKVLRAAKALRGDAPDPAAALSFDKLVNAYELVVPRCAELIGNPKDCLSNDEFLAQKEKLRLGIEANRHISILFLIDGTTSNDVYFPATAQAIEKYVEKLRGGKLKGGSDEQEISISAYVYGDYLGAEPGVADDKLYFDKLADWHSITRDEGIDKETARLQKLAQYRPTRATDPVHRDYLEAPFAALIRAAEKQRWERQNGIRILVHIADDGNRDAGASSPDDVASPKLVETMTVDDVAKALLAERIIYVPINVVGRPGKETGVAADAREAFLKQAAELKSAAYSDKHPVAKAYSNLLAPESMDERTKAVEDAINLGVNVSMQALDVARTNSRCAVGAAADDPECDRHSKQEAEQKAGIGAMRIVHDELVAEGLSESQISYIQNRRQTVSYVWAPPVDRSGSRSQLKYYVAMTYHNLLGLENAIEGLCQRVVIDDPDTAPQFKRGINDLFEEWVGQPNNELSLGAILSLPLVERSVALSYTPDEVDTMVSQQDYDALRKLKESFCKSSYLLQAVRGDKKIDLAELHTKGPGVYYTSSDAGKRYVWFVSRGQGERIYYVPIEYLPE